MSNNQTFRLPSYRIAECCGIDCQHGTLDGPCWGQCGVVDEDGGEDDFTFIHACKGHEDYCGEYKPPTDPANLAAWEEMRKLCNQTE